MDDIERRMNKTRARRQAKQRRQVARATRDEINHSQGSTTGFLPGCMVVLAAFLPIVASLLVLR